MIINSEQICIDEGILEDIFGKKYTPKQVTMVEKLCAVYYNEALRDVEKICRTVKRVGGKELGDLRKC